MNFKEIHIKAVVLNVYLIMIVREIKRVSPTNARTLVLEFVDRMQFVQFWTIYLYALVLLVPAEMLSFIAKQYKVCHLHLYLCQLIFSSKSNFIDHLLVVEDIHPCHPNPCGQNSECRESNGHAVCSCVQGYLGAPPTCHPECNVNSDCDKNEACSNQKCNNPCLGACGVSAICEVINHYPFCKCPPRYTGNPSTRCSLIRKFQIFISVYCENSLFQY